MKKMVCEICGSQSIRKENGVFVCQECGTEYSVEEAKKLLQEVDASGEAPKTETLGVSETYKEDKNKLLQYLSSWLKVIAPFEHMSFWTGKECSGPITDAYVDELLNSQKLAIPNLNPDGYWSDEFSPDKDCHYLYPNIDFTKGIEKAVRNSPKCKKFLAFIEEKKDETYEVQSLAGTFQENKYVWKNKGENVEYLFKDFALYGKPVSVEIWLVKMALEGMNIVAMERHREKKLGLLLVKREDISFQFDFRGIATEINNLISLFSDRHEELKKYYADHFDGAMEEYRKLKGEISQLNSVFPLPQQYRNSSVIIYMMNLFEDGRAETWKEAANLFELEQNFSRVIKKLDDIDKKISNIDKKLNLLAYAALDISSSLSNIYSKIEEIDGGVNSIMLNTRYSLIASYLDGNTSVMPIH